MAQKLQQRPGLLASYPSSPENGDIRWQVRWLGLRDEIEFVICDLPLVIGSFAAFVLAGVEAFSALDHQLGDRPGVLVSNRASCRDCSPGSCEGYERHC